MQENINSKKKINVEIRIKPSLETSLEVNSNFLQVGTKRYVFNKVHITTTQKQLFDSSIRPLIDNFIEGYNCTVLAYGQTGSGKTYTMGISHDDTSGIVPNTLEYLFKRECIITCTFIEVYNEEVIDLLTEHKVPLNLRESNKDVVVAGAKEINIKDLEEALNILKKGCLERTTKSTKMNSQSSRSHAIFTIFYHCPSKGFTSKFSFVDLAGSERLKRTLCTGDRAKESISINSGLLALGNVISSLYLRKTHIPFRDSKLTRILQSCLNGHVLMIACISSLHTDINETNNTLKYANRAASIEMTIKKNVEVDSSKYEVIKLKKQIQILTQENQILKERIRKVSHMNIEELLKENRKLKKMVDLQRDSKDDVNRSEDIAQVIIKHPFVQNLINENDKLRNEHNLKNKLDNDKIYNDSYNIDNKIDNNIKLDYDSYNIYNNNNKIENNNIDNKLDNVSYYIDNKLDKNKLDNNNNNKLDNDIDNKLDNNIDNNKIYKENIITQENNNNNIILQKKHVTFDISPPKRKSSIWTPRKERVLMDTFLKDKVTGYIAHNMIVHNNKLIFSSYDNKIRIRDPSSKILEMCTDSGIKCLYSDDNILYSTRMILKQIDHRVLNIMPVYAYRNEISCIYKLNNTIYTGHEDGTLSILDIRNMTLKSDKIHSSTIFSIEVLDGTLYTGSRDHTVKSLNLRDNTRKTLQPPHYDVVNSVIKYKGEIISLSRDCSLKRWRDGVIIKTVPNAHSSWIKCGVSLTDSFITGSKNGTLRYWDYCEDSVFCVGSYQTGNINCMVKWNEGFYVGSQNKEIVYLVTNYK